MWQDNQLYLCREDTSVFTEDDRFILAKDIVRGFLQHQAEKYCEIYSVRKTFSPLYKEAQICASMQTQLLYGEPFEVHYIAENQAYGRSLMDGYVGWVSLDALQKGFERPSHLVCISFAPLYAEPTLKQTPLLYLPAAALVRATGRQEKGYVQLECGRWVHEAHIIDQPMRMDMFLSMARNFINAPYVWGGRTALGIDCSGLVQLALSLTGKRIHRDTDLQYRTLGHAVEQGDLRAGDIAFFPGHVGIMLDPDTILHANATNMAVTIDPLQDVIGWVAKETDKKAFRGGKRI